MKPKANINADDYYEHRYASSISNLDLGTKTRPDENLTQPFTTLYLALEPDSVFITQVSSHPFFSLSFWSWHSIQTFKHFKKYI